VVRGEDAAVRGEQVFHLAVVERQPAPEVDLALRDILLLLILALDAMDAPVLRELGTLPSVEGQQLRVDELLATGLDLCELRVLVEECGGLRLCFGPLLLALFS
jgi:hypothetical protein